MKRNPAMAGQMDFLRSRKKKATKYGLVAPSLKA
jgi:hypothetical protein